MAQELFGNILDGVNAAVRHVTNADFLPLALIGGAIVLIAYFLFKS
jgi:hypothetical protein